jgi:predicted N-acyltransferase
MSGLEVAIVETIDKVDPGELNRLAVDATYTWGWLKTFERLDSVDLSPRHIVVRNGDGLVAFAPCFVQRSAIFDDLREELLLRWQTRALEGLHRTGSPWLRLNPCLVSGAPEGFSSRILLSEDKAQDPLRVFELVVQGLLTQAEADGIGSYGFMAVPESDAQLGGFLRQAGFSSSLRTANAVLEVRWDDFPTYLSSLKRSPRKSVKHEEAAYRRHGYGTRLIEDLGPIAADLSRLAGNPCHRHSSKPNPFTPALYEDLARYMPGGAMALVAEAEDRICGFVLLLEHEGRMTVHHYGTDYSAQARSGHIYYSLAYSATIRHAIQRGIHTIAYGPGEWRAKARKGCTFEKINICLKGRGRIGDLLLGLLFRYVDRQKNRWILDRLGHPGTV